ncbi:MAG: outer membrane protein assembly factor BamD [Candidatus Cloacimonetes bacterium]|nr:outer membrane protein assembly factor BamD [Candidatus Cloacimonadota bacterium]
MKKIVLSAILLAILLGCSSVKVSKTMPVDIKMQKGYEYFNNENYKKAQPFFMDVAFERNSSFTAEAQMRVADCYFFQEKYADARFEYQELIRLFKDYKDIDLAYFNIAVCYYNESLAPAYTQEETQSAIDAFNVFIERFPFSSHKQEAFDYLQKCYTKLLEKTYENGYTYYKMSDYSAALMYFDEIISLGNTSEIDKLSLYYSAKIYLKRKDLLNAQKTADILQKRYPEAKQTTVILQKLSKR